MLGISQVVIKTLEVLRSVYDDLKDKSTMVTPLQIGSQLVDWTDPQKAVYVVFLFYLSVVGSRSRRRSCHSAILRASRPTIRYSLTSQSR